MTEIEELRAEIDKLLDDFLKECEQNKQLKLENDRLREEIEVMIAGDRLLAENDRLREALEKIMGLDLDEACAIANEALSKGVSHD